MATKQDKGEPKTKVVQVYLLSYTRDYHCMQEKHIKSSYCICCNECTDIGHGGSHGIEKHLMTGKHKRHAAVSSTIQGIRKSLK